MSIFPSCTGLRVFCFKVLMILIAYDAAPASTYAEVKNHIAQQRPHTTYTAIARDLGVSPTTVSTFHRGITTQPRSLLAAWKNLTPPAAAHETLRPSAQGTAYEELSGYITQKRAQAATYKAIANDLGVSPTTVANFHRSITKQPRRLLAAWKNLPPAAKGAQNADTADQNLAPQPSAAAGENDHHGTPDGPAFSPPDGRKKLSHLAVMKALAAKDVARAQLVYNIGIPIRGSLDAKDGAGTFFDHFVFQNLSGVKTVMLLPEGTTENNILRHVQAHTRVLGYDLRATQLGRNGARLPEAYTGDSFECGLLVIPGRRRGVDSEYNATRQAHEHAVLRAALLRGQPVLGICAGSWRLWQALWAAEIDPEYNNVSPRNREALERALEATLTNVEGHVGAHMMSLSRKTPGVQNNEVLHGLKMQPKSLLKIMLTHEKHYPPSTMQVNSVHWKAPQLYRAPGDKKAGCPPGIAIAAHAKNPRGTVANNAAPQEGVIEAFESISGAPIIGVGWHPEAAQAQDPKELYSKYNIALIRGMADAGKTYQKKRAVFGELSAIFRALAPAHQE